MTIKITNGTKEPTSKFTIIINYNYISYSFITFVQIEYFIYVMEMM